MSPYVFKTRVSFTDIDADACLSLKGAMRLMQEAAMIHSDHSGYSVLDVEHTRVVWMLVQWRVRLVGTARWNEYIEVITWPRSMERLTSVRCFRIVNTAGETVAVADSNWLLANADTGRVMRIPKEVADAYDLIDEDVFEGPMPKLPHEAGEETYTCTVLRRDLDTNKHVNNLVYLDYAAEAIAEQKTFCEANIRYHLQLLLGDEVHCHYENTPEGHLVQITGEDPKHLHCTVLLS